MHDPGSTLDRKNSLEAIDVNSQQHALPTLVRMAQQNPGELGLTADFVHPPTTTEQLALNLLQLAAKCDYSCYS